MEFYFDYINIPYGGDTPETARTGELVEAIAEMLGKPPAPTAQPKPQAAAPPPTKIIKRGECGYEGGNVTFTLDENGVLTISGNGRMRDMRTIDDTPWWDEHEKIVCAEIQRGVTSIGRGAFNGCAGLKSVAIPDSITRIEHWAFNGCAGLESVAIPNSVTYIGEGAFNGCAGLESVAIPDGVTSIGVEAFYGCAGLKSVAIPDSITRIEYWAFNGCAGLESVAIPDGVTSIGDWAFNGCAGLESVAIPDSVSEIGWRAFDGCKNLKSVSVPAKAEIDRDAFPSWVRIERRA